MTLSVRRYFPLKSGDHVGLFFSVLGALNVHLEVNRNVYKFQHYILLRALCVLAFHNTIESLCCSQMFTYICWVFFTARKTLSSPVAATKEQQLHVKNGCQDGWMNDVVRKIKHEQQNQLNAFAVLLLGVQSPNKCDNRLACLQQFPQVWDPLFTLLMERFVGSLSGPLMAK